MLTVQYVRRTGEVFESRLFDMENDFTLTRRTLPDLRKACHWLIVEMEQTRTLAQHAEQMARFDSMFADADRAIRSAVMRSPKEGIHETSH